MTTKLTARDRILLTLADQPGLTLEQLCVAAWKRHPNTFGLRGFEEQYPDTHRFLGSGVLGAKGVFKKGLVHKAADGTCTLLPDGLKRVAELKGEALPPAQVTQLPRERLEVLARVFASEAVRLLAENRTCEVTDKDAFDLWRLTRGCDVDRCLAVVREALAEVEGDVVLPGGRQLSPGEIRAASHFVGRLEDRFKRQLDGLRFLRGQPAKTA